MQISMMQEELPRYLIALQLEELSKTTIAKYERDISFFLRQFADRSLIDKGDVIDYKNQLLSSYKTNTVNSYLISLNRYLRWMGDADLAVKPVRRQVQRHLENVVNGEEYRQMLRCCLEKGRERDYALLRTLAGTGIRVGELQFITCESAARGTCEIYNKRKSRLILISQELSQLLYSYQARHGITSGIIFLGRGPNAPLEPKSVWKLLKRLALEAGVDPRKVYPHSFRHLFAKTYMEKIGNVMVLADLLGHSSLETTRIYAMASLEEERRSLSTLGL